MLTSLACGINTILLILILRFSPKFYHLRKEILFHHCLSIKISVLISVQMQQLKRQLEDVRCEYAELLAESESLNSVKEENG